MLSPQSGGFLKISEEFGSGLAGSEYKLISIFRSLVYSYHKSFKIKMNNKNSFFKGRKAALDIEP
jgi:hypothetical protein